MLDNTEQVARLMLSIEIHGLEKLIAKLDTGARPVIRQLTRAVAEELQGALARYPGPVAYPIAWASPAQRAAYFARRRKAGLGPYVRNSDPFSQRLGPSWAVERRGDMDAAVGTRVSYAPWVQSAEHQQPMHRNTGWITDEQAIAKVEDSGAIERIIADVMKQEGW